MQHRYWVEISLHALRPARVSSTDRCSAHETFLMKEQVTASLLGWGQPARLAACTRQPSRSLLCSWNLSHEGTSYSIATGLESACTLCSLHASAQLFAALHRNLQSKLLRVEALELSLYQYVKFLVPAGLRS